jgi:copper chaperone CopZ
MIKTVQVDNIKCQGCANTIKTTLEKEGFKDVSIDLSCEPREISFGLKNEAQVAHMRTVLRNLGYSFSDEKSGFVESTKLKAKSFVSCAIGKFSDTK